MIRKRLYPTLTEYIIEKELLSACDLNEVELYKRYKLITSEKGEELVKKWKKKDIITR